MSAPRRRHRLATHPVGTWSRRQFLQRFGAALTVSPWLSGCGSSEAPLGGGSGLPTPAETPFRHGVASGDPLPDRVVFWTRVTVPIDLTVPVRLEVFADPGLAVPVAQAVQLATAARDHTVKIDLAGLLPATTYYYRFSALGWSSDTGRTRTAPEGEVARLRFGVVSCSSFAHGYFNAYRLLAQRADLDAVVHLGDYIYEYGTGEYGDIRPYEPDHEIISLEDYRRRHAYYKREDADLRELHRQFPFLTIWDDHESTDNSWRDGAANHQLDEGDWAQRKAWAQQAYDEWMPIRYPEPGNVARIWRRYQYGNLVDLFLLDTRLFDRDEPLGLPVTPLEPATDPGRRLLGPEQRAWLLDGLASSPARWKLVGNQVVFHQWIYQPGLRALGGPRGLNGDSWDGYMAERYAVIDRLRADGVENLVILTGDVHSTWIADLSDDPLNALAYNPLTGQGSVGVEFVCTSVTSPFLPLPDLSPLTDAFRVLNPHIKFLDLVRKGYLLLDVTPERVTGEVYAVDRITEPGGGEAFEVAFAVEQGRNRLGPRLSSPTSPPASPPPLAP